MQSETAPPKLLSTVEAAAVLRVSAGTLEVWRSTKRWELRYHKIGAKVFYLESDLKDFIENGARGASGSIKRPTRKQRASRRAA